MKRLVVLLLLVALAGCAMFVPSDFKRSAAADDAVLTVLAERYVANPAASAQTEAWQRIKEIADNAVLRQEWLKGNSVNWAKLRKVTANEEAAK